MQEAIEELRRVGPRYADLPDSYKTAALRQILTGSYRDRANANLAEREYGKRRNTD